MEAGLPNPWGLGGDLPDLATLPPILDGNLTELDTLPDTLPILDGSLPVLDTLPAVGSPSHDQPEKKAGMSHMAKPLKPAMVARRSCNGSEGSHVEPAVGDKKKAGVKDQPLVAEPVNGLPLLPGVSCNGSDVKPAVGGKEQAGVSDQPPVVESIDDLSLLPGFSCDGSEGRHVKPAFGWQLAGSESITDLPKLPEDFLM